MIRRAVGWTLPHGHANDRSNTCKGTDMEVGWDQMVAVALLTIAAAAGIGTLLLALSLTRALIRWIVGAGVSNDVARA